MFNLENIPWNLILPIILLQVILMVVALVDIVRNKKTNGPFIMWLFIIIFVNLLGPIIYFIFGRRNE